MSSEENYRKQGFSKTNAGLLSASINQGATTEEKILYWAKQLEHKSLSVHELVENAKWLLEHCQPKQILSEMEQNILDAQGNANEPR
jgi:hypothetical protein